MNVAVPANTQATSFPRPKEAQSTPTKAIFGHV